MRLIWQGTDITDKVNVRGAVYTDDSGGHLDRMEISLGDPARWYSWRPEKGDTIRAEEDGFDTGDMFLDSVEPEGDLFRVTALSAKDGAMGRRWDSFENEKLKNITARIAGECGMGYAMYGISGGTEYRYMLRKNEKGLGFLHRIAQSEGAVVKCVNGKIVMIGIEYAQKLPVAATIRLDEDMSAWRHVNTPGMRESARYLYDTQGRLYTAYDTDGRGEPRPAQTIMTDDPLEAARQARGLLLTCNRQAEHIYIKSAFDPRMTAMCRVDTVGQVPGKWLVGKAVHDLFNRTSKLTLDRVIDTII